MHQRNDRFVSFIWLLLGSIYGLIALYLVFLYGEAWRGMLLASWSGGFGEIMTFNLTAFLASMSLAFFLEGLAKRKE